MVNAQMHKDARKCLPVLFGLANHAHLVLQDLVQHMCHNTVYIHVRKLPVIICQSVLISQ